MTVEAAQTVVYAALEAVKGTTESVAPNSSLTQDLGLESIDVVDLFFEIEQATGTVIELNQLMGHEGKVGRRFADITVQDLVDYLAAAPSD